MTAVKTIQLTEKEAQESVGLEPKTVCLREE